MQSARNGIIGWGVDAPRENRPGHPKELEPPRKMGQPPYDVPEQQQIGGVHEPSVQSPLHPLPPVYGTVVPPRALSGLVRKLAYRLPESRRRRWMLLMVADRIDVLEHTLLPGLFTVGGVATLAFAGFLGARRLLRG
jgi:hypothetical protein